MLRASLAVMRTDLRRELRTGEALVPMLLFAVVVLVVAGFTFDLPELGPADRRRLAPGILWTAIAFATMVGQARALLAERDEERWSGLLLAPLDRSLVFAIKWIEGTILGVALEVVLLPLAIALFDLDVGGGRLLPLAGVLVVCTAGLSALGTLLGSAVARLGRGEALLAILVLPAAVPLLIAGVKSSVAVLDSGGLAAAASWPGIAAATTAIYAVLGAMLFESVLVE